MNEVRNCPQCDSQLPLDAPSGICPKCVIRLGMAGAAGPEITRTRAHNSGFQPPKPSELAESFPQLEILELIGQGGMGAVYKARQRGLDRLVALKILAPEISRDPSFAERFLREARALARLDHPNIVGVHDSGNAGDYFFLLMEFVDGMNLRQAVHHGTLATHEALAIVPQICDALQFAHDAGVVHRDIKPENVLLDKSGNVKVADFGLAKMIEPNADQFTLTGTHQVMGTPRYMAPEQIEHTREVDHRADIYSLGVVFYELLTGELPLGRFAAPSKKVQVDVRLDEVVLRTLEKEPDRRYQRASEIRTDVDSICHPEQTPRSPRMGYEYRSEKTLFGLPLVHVATGINPKTGRSRIAKGIIAIGDKAVGGLAIGGVSAGIISVGGVSVGIFAIGGLSVGILFALAGLAISGGLALGGVSVGWIAAGGLAVGTYAYGGAAIGTHSLGGTGETGNAWRAYNHLSFHVPEWLLGAQMILSILFSTLIYTVASSNRPTGESDGSSVPQKTGAANAGLFQHQSRRSSHATTGCVIALLFGFVCVPCFCLLPTLWYVSRARSSQEAAVQRLHGVVEESIFAADVAEAQAIEQDARSLWEDTGLNLIYTEGKVRVTDEFVQAMGVTVSQRKRIEDSMTRMHAEYLKLEQKHRVSTTDDSKRQKTEVAQFDEGIEQLENELWTEIDPVLTVDQQSRLRLNVRLGASDSRMGEVRQNVMPGLFGWGGEKANIETWKSGQWFHWKVVVLGLTHEDRGPKLPTVYERFWREDVEAEVSR